MRNLCHCDHNPWRDREESRDGAPSSTYAGAAMTRDNAAGERRLPGVLRPLQDAPAELDDDGWHWCTKDVLSTVANSIKRAFASASAQDLLGGPSDGGERLVLAFFQRRAYFEVEAERYEAFAAMGATVVIGFPGSLDGLAPELHGVDLTGREQLVDAWALVAIGANFAAALVAVDDRGFVEDAPRLEASRSFLARWTFRRDEAVDACRQLIGPLTARLPARVLARAESALARAVDDPVTPAEEHLHTVLDSLARAFEIRRRSASGRQGSVEEAADFDLLTGLRTRRALDRYLESRAGESAALVIALLIDVDDLGLLNARAGEDAGDAALVAIAASLRGERRSGDIIVRSGDDEFLVLTPHDGSDGPLSLAERVVHSVRALRLPPPFERESVTVSVGAIVADPVRIPFERLQDGLHLAKLLGKDSARLVE